MTGPRDLIRFASGAFFDFAWAPGIVALVEPNDLDAHFVCGMRYGCKYAHEWRWDRCGGRM